MLLKITSYPQVLNNKKWLFFNKKKTYLQFHSLYYYYY